MGCILEQQTFTGKLCCSPLTCLGSTGPCSCVKLCSLCLLLRKSALESMFCRIWLEVAASFCWCSCHPSAASYSMSLLDKVSSALHLFLLRAFYVPSESIFWASDTLFLAASSSAGCLEHFPPHSCECLMQTSLRHWPHSSPCAALAEVIFTPRRRVKNVIQKCTLGALLPPCVTASSFLWNSISLRHILGFFPPKNVLSFLFT